MPHVTIDHRFRGPADSGNGGYSSGLLAQFVDAQPAVRVRLHRPPPLDQVLRVEQREGAASLWWDENLIAEAERADLELTHPTPLDLEAAEAASAHYAPQQHLLPQCFTCGPQRDDGDGLRLFPARADRSGPVAAPWVPGPSVCDAQGHVLPPVLWAALDCPGYFAHGLQEVALLGTMTARLRLPVRGGEPLVAMGWSEGAEGRKLHSGTALFDAQGRLCAESRQLWIKLRN